MPPISSSRLAPRTSCSSSAASIWLSQVRRSCLGALRKSLVEISAGRFMGLPFLLGVGAIERPARDGADEVAPVLGAIVEIFRRVDCGGRRVGSGIERLG